MLDNHNPIVQTLLGTLFTWGMTAIGAGLVFCFNSSQRKVLDASLGFAAGVMTAASYWSLLAPAIEMAESSGIYGAKGQFAFVPCAIGFLLGALFVFGADYCLPSCSNVMTSSGNLAVEMDVNGVKAEDKNTILLTVNDDYSASVAPSDSARQRKPLSRNGGDHRVATSSAPARLESPVVKSLRWRRILLLIIAITVHNIPEGLAVGVGFGAVGKTKSATFESARNLAFGIGIQNFPEGLAVSLPLRGSGMSPLKSFWYGQLSGMVEPAAGVLGALAVSIAEPILPYALSFAAGAMIFVVVDDIIPEAQVCGNGKLASWGSAVGFVVMMSLDVGLG